MGLAALVISPAPIEVLLATWNGGPYLEPLLQSIRAQTLPPQRLLVRDDGSSDGTAQRLQQLALQWPDWLILLPAGKRLGSTGNFAALLAASTAPYLALADQDDLWDPRKLERNLELLLQMEASRPAPIPVLVHSDLRLIDGQGQPIAPSFLRHQRLNPSHCSSDALVLQNVVTGCSCLFNRPLLDRALPFPTAVTQHDHWLALVASRCGLIGMCPEPLLSYRQHGRNAIGASGAGWRYLGQRLLQLGRRNGPMARLQAALAQADALQERCPGPPLALVQCAGAPPLQRLARLRDRRLRKQGWRRQLGLLLLLPWLARRRPIASID